LTCQPPTTNAPPEREPVVEPTMQWIVENPVGVRAFRDDQWDHRACCHAAKAVPWHQSNSLLEPLIVSQ
jgi:hypothetical protein